MLLYCYEEMNSHKESFVTTWYHLLPFDKVKYMMQLEEEQPKVGFETFGQEKCSLGSVWWSLLAIHTSLTILTKSD